MVNESLSPLGSTLWQSIGFEGRPFKEYSEGEQVHTADCRFMSTVVALCNPSETDLNVLYLLAICCILLKRNMVCGATLAFRAFLKNLVLPIPPFAILLHDTWIALVASSVGFYGVPFSNSWQSVAKDLWF